MEKFKNVFGYGLAEEEQNEETGIMDEVILPAAKKFNVE